MQTERPILGSLVSASHTQNSGFAFGMLQKTTSPMRSLFFIAVPVFALVLIVLIFIKLQDDQMMTSLALSSILGGAVGNLVDRLSLGYVVDFVKIVPLGLPPFNVADAAILVGVILMFISTWTQTGREPGRE